MANILQKICDIFSTMTRPWRIELEGAYYHILSRGNEKRNIFRDNDDRVLFLETLEKMSDRFEVEVYAYVLMDNHYHLLLKTNKPNISKSMQWFGTTYTRRYNIKHKRYGHLFQGRFKSFLIENDEYLMHLSCYIHRNPLRAGIVKRLADYPWSSYPIYAYNKKSPEWLLTNPILSLFDTKDKHMAYRKWYSIILWEKKDMGGLPARSFYGFTKVYRSYKVQIFVRKP